MRIPRDVPGRQAPELGHCADLNEHTTIQDLFGEEEATSFGRHTRHHIKTPVNLGGEDTEASVPRVGRSARLPTAWRF